MKWPPVVDVVLNVIGPLTVVIDHQQTGGGTRIDRAGHEGVGDVQAVGDDEPAGGIGRDQTGAQRAIGVEVDDARRQREAGKAAGQIESIPRPKLRGKIVAIFKSDRNGAAGLIGDEQMVFGEESGKEQAMPMLIGRQLREMADTLKPGA